MTKKQFQIDPDFLKKCAKKKKCEPIIREYLVNLHNSPTNKFDEDFHIHYAVRLTRAIENAPEKSYEN